MKHIPDELYQQIHEVLPIACVDVIIKKSDAFLLAKRNNKPAQGQWFLPGGRVLKGESLKEAAGRKIQEEIGIKVTIEKILGIDETTFPDGPFGGPTHTINIVFLATPLNENETIILDKQNSEYRWFSHIDDSWHPYVKKFAKLAGLTKKIIKTN